MANKDVIEITPIDLEVIRAALHSAHMQNVVLDMADQYRKLNNRDNPSPMTRALDRAHDLVATYIAVDEEEEPSE